MGPEAKTTSEYGHVAYQIKTDDGGSNMVSNILRTDTPNPGVGVIGQTISFSESSHVANQTKNLTMLAATW